MTRKTLGKFLNILGKAFQIISKKRFEKKISSIEVLEKNKNMVLLTCMPKKKNQLKLSSELTVKQRSFVDILVKNWGKISKVDAAKQAGYESKQEYGPRDIASRLMNPDLNPHVVRYFEKRYQEELDKKEKDKLRKYNRFDHLSKKAEEKGQFGHAINAEFRSGQMAGMFVDKREVKHVGLEGMNREQLESRLAELEKKIGEGKNIIDVTPEKINEK